MNKKLMFLLSVVITIWLSSCYKDKIDFSKLSTNINWNPNMAVPALHSSLTIRDLLRDYDSTELFVEDQTGFLYLMYHNQVFSIPASDLVTLPDQNFSDNFTGTDFISAGFPVPNTTQTITKNYTHILVLGFPTDVFDSLVFKSGTFTVNVTSTFLHTGLLTITFPTVKKNGSPYSQTVNINTNTGTFSYNQAFSDLAGYNADFTNPAFNQLPVKLSLTLVSSGAGVIPGDQVDVDMFFSNLKYSILYGDIGQRPIPIQEDTVNIEIFNNTLQGEVYFMAPVFRLYLRNTFGVPLSAAFSDFKIYSAVSHNYVSYTYPAENPLTIGAPTIPGQSVTTTIQLDTLNFPSIRTVVHENPRYLQLSTTALTNPPGTSQYNFITDTSYLAVDLEVELPLWGRASKWVLQDTLNFNFSDYYEDSVPDLDNIEWVKFHINILNGMPTEARVQIYFTDTSYNIIDSIFTPENNGIIQSGILGGTGKVVSPTPKITDVMVYSNKLSGLLGVKKALVRGYISTTKLGATNIRFYADYAIDVKMGVQIQAKLNTNTDFH